MKYCRNCGALMDDKAVVCVKCGCAAENEPSQKKAPSTLSTVAKVFMVLGCIAGAFCFLIPLCWTIPMTVSYSNAVKNGKSVSIGFKICALLFVNIIAGILMLCDKDGE